MRFSFNNEKKFQIVMLLLSIFSLITIISLGSPSKEDQNRFNYSKVITLKGDDSFVYFNNIPSEEVYLEVINNNGNRSQLFRLDDQMIGVTFADLKDATKIALYSNNYIGNEEVKIGYIDKSLVSSLNRDAEQNVLGAEISNKESIERKVLDNAGIDHLSYFEWSGDPGNESTISFSNVIGIKVIPIPQSGSSTKDLLQSMRLIHSKNCKKDCDTYLDINYILDKGGVVYEGFPDALYNESDSNNESGWITIGVIEGETNQQVNSLRKLTSTLIKVNGLVEESVTFDNFLESEDFADFINKYQHGGSETLKISDIEIDNSEEGLLLRSEYEKSNVVKTKGEVQLIRSMITSESEQILQLVDANLVAQNLDTEIEVFNVPQESVIQVVNTINLLSDEGSVIQPNYVYKTFSWDNTDPERAIPSDYDLTTHWNYEAIKTPEIWSDLGGCSTDSSCGGDPSVVVAVLDTGVAYENYDYDTGSNFTTVQHDPFYFEVPQNDTPDGVFNEGYDRRYLQAPELAGVNFVHPFDSWQYYSCNSLRLEGTPDPCNTAEGLKVYHANDDHGHGTFVTTIIAGTTGDTAPNKLIGTAHNVSIMPVKVFTPNDTSMCQDDNGDIDLLCTDPDYDYRAVAFTTNILDGIQHAVANGAEIINMSLGGVGTDLLLNDAIQSATDDGILVVVAAGNDGDDATYYFPANSPGAFVVGAVTDTNARASYSNYGAEIDLVAPVGDSGSSMLASMKYACSSDSSCSDETDPNLFQFFSSQTSPSVGIGTSYAAPQVAAAAALLLSDDPAMTVSELKSVLTTSAYDLGTAGKDTNFGYGLLDMEAALGREENVPEAEPNDQYFTWYDTSKTDRLAWVLVGNPSETSVATVGIKIGNVITREYTIQPGSRITPSWTGYMDGPVHITSDLPVYATQRVSYEGSFNEYSGIPVSSLDTKYYFTWFDTSKADRKAWVLVGNPSETETASVNIKVGTKINQNFTITPKSRITPTWTNVLDGPVVVTSNIPVYATQRVHFAGSFNEYAGIPATSLDTKYYFTWYDVSKVGRDAWVLVGNPSATETASVNIKIGSNVNQNFTISPGSRITPRWFNFLDGPVVVTSNIPVYTTQRVHFEGSFNEYAGIPATLLGSKYYFTWYDVSKPDRLAWVLVGNPSATETASVNIKISDRVNQNYTIPPGGRITPSWTNFLDGPVVVTSNIPVYTTQRVHFAGSFNEYPGIISE